jgi:hypothetical protein
MIWLWRNPRNITQKRLGQYVKDSGTDRFEFLEAKKLPIDGTVAPKVQFECDKKFATDILPNGSGLIIVSQKVLRVMQEICRDDFQHINANVFFKNEQLDDYFLINILSKVDILDKEMSSFTLIKGTTEIMNIEKIVYSTNELNVCDIARNKDYLSHVLVSEKLKNVFEHERFQGAEFRLEPV